MTENSASNDSRPNAVAVIGMACRFPGANSVAEFWRNLRDGVESIVPLSDETLRAAAVPEAHITDPSYVKAAAILDRMEEFDAGFFGFSPKEASIMDPQHRHFLECCWEALEDAGYNPYAFDGSVGVFAGCGMQAYFTQNLVPNRKLMDGTGLFLVRHTGNDKDFLPTRVSYQFNLRGPSIAIQTACSTSLVAIHAAAQSLLSGECDLAIAGGSTIELPHRQGYHYQEGEILSHDGHCRSFDAASTGTVFGSGTGAVILKRLDQAQADGDSIYAVIIGSAVNNDGAKKVSYLAPSVDGQAAAVSEAMAVAGVDASSITYVETHGTGTQIGDPIEVTALTQAFRESSSGRGYCALGAAKTNIGHLDTAAGVAGFIKTVLALKNRQIPPTLHFQRPNPQIQFETTPFFVNAALRDWKLPAGVPVRRAGVNSLGVGGTNAHVILEEAPPPQARPTSARPAYLLAWSGRSEAVLDAMTRRFAEHLRQNPDLNLADAEFTLRYGRNGFKHRRVVAVRDVADALATLEARDAKRIFSGNASESAPSLAFAFPGGGVQYPNMGLQLHQSEPLYQKSLDEALSILRQRWQIDLTPLLFPAPGKEAWAAEQLERPLYSILSIFVTERSMAELLIARGIKPAIMTGHSLGEYTAACISGVISLEDTLAIVVARGKIFERLPAGAMLSVRLDEAELRPHLTSEHSLAAVNGPNLCVVSGTVEALDTLAAKLDALDVENQRLRINVAAHSQMLEPFLDEFRATFRTIRFNPPKIPFVSNLTGKVAQFSDIGNGEYWVRHLRNTVRFSDGLRALQAAMPNSILLEVGPGNALSSLANLHEIRSVPSMRHPKEIGPDHQFLLSALGRIWSFGYPVDWELVAKSESPRRISLPTYPFEHQRYWIEPVAAQATPAIEPKELVRRPQVQQWFSRPTWREGAKRRNATGPRPDVVLLFGGTEPVATGVASALEARSTGSPIPLLVVRLALGSQFARTSPSSFQIDPAAENSIERVLSELGGMEQRHLAVINLEGTDIDPENVGTAPELGEKHLLHLVSLARALGGLTEVKSIRLVTVTANAFSIAGECAVDAGSNLVVGAMRVVPREFPAVRSVLIDVSGPSLAGTQRAALLGDIAEEVLDGAETREIAFRGGRIWTPELAPYSPVDPKNTKTLLRHGGVYLITGGLGGLGAELARHLAQKHQARLILLSRSSSAGKAGAETLRQVQAQTDVLIVHGDVADPVALEATVKSAEARFGRIDGVFHCAGIVDDQLIATKSAESVRNVLRAKVSGAYALETVFRNRRLDFFLLYSSTSSWLGLPGQVDYAAANAYLDALAARWSAPWPVKTIGWGAWRDVGIAARLVSSTLPSADRPAIPPQGHPFLGSAKSGDGERRAFSSLWEADKLWVLDGHRNKAGVALFPGTGYLELARAALETPAASVTISELVFISPLVVEGPTETRIEVDRQGDFVVASRPVEPTGTGDWIEHARGNVRTASATPQPARVDIDALRGQCNVRSRELSPGDPITRQDSMLRFGKRWANLRRAWFGRDVALGEMSLPAEFTDDLARAPFHPSLVDIATGFALPLVQGYETSNWFYVPLSYREVQIFRPLPATFYSIARCLDTKQSETVTLDVTFASTSGDVLAQISGFTMKRLPDTQLKVSQVRSVTPTREASSTAPGGLPTLETLVAGGISPAEGMEALEMMLTATAPAHAFASPFEPGLWARLLDATSTAATTAESATAGTDGPVSQPRPKISTPYVAPEGDAALKLAAIWKDALGIAEVGMEDNYFELGGNSLGLVQLIMKCRKAIKVTIPVGDPELLANPTMRAMMKYISAPKAATEAPPEAGLKRISRDRFKVDRTALKPSE